MNISILVGFIIVFFAVIIGNPDMRVDPAAYLRWDAFILVFFGMLGSTMISSSFADLRGMLKVLFALMIGKEDFYSPEKTVQTLVSIAEKAQSTPRQQLPELVKNINDKGIQRGIELLSTGLEKDFILQTLDTDVAELINRHDKMVRLVSSMGTYAPMFGMAGTVIGVIQVLKNVSDIDNIVSGMALALLTTLYGLFFSSVLFSPLSNKLRNLSQREVLSKEIITEGVSMIYDREIPLKVSKYLSAFLHSISKNSVKKI